MTADQVYHLAGKGHVAYQSILLIKANLLAIVGSLTRAGIAIARVSLVHGRWRRGPLRPVAYFHYYNGDRTSSADWLVCPRGDVTAWRARSLAYALLCHSYQPMAKTRGGLFASPASKASIADMAMGECMHVADPSVRG